MNLTSLSLNGFSLDLLTDPLVNRHDLESICNYLAGIYQGEKFLSEQRSVVIPIESNLSFNGIKIKGCGYLGGRVDFSAVNEQGHYDLPYFDYEGNYIPDLCRSFHYPCLGGMSYQQARNEYQISVYLNEHNFQTYKPLGYGCISKDAKQSWFCLLNAPFVAYWSWCRPDYDKELVLQIPKFVAESQLQLYELGVMLVLHGPTNISGQLRRKDFHAARFMSENDSFMSKLCYFCFDTNFILATLANKIFDTGIKNWVDFAWSEYILGLTNKHFSIQQISDFKETLLKIKTADDLRIYERVRILQANQIGEFMLEKFLPEFEKLTFHHLNELESV